MTKNYLINAFRSKVNQPVYEEYINYKDKLSVNDTEDNLLYEEFHKKFVEAMKSLPVTQQKVITLSKIKQLSNKEIAQQLSLSEQTVKNQLSVGLKALKEKLGIVYFIYMLFFIN